MKDWRQRRDAANKSAFLNMAPPEKWKFTLAERFKAYWERIHPDPMTRPSDESTQFIETRRSFYAGVFDMLCTMRAVAEPGAGEDEATEHLEALYRECVAYYRKIKELYGIE